MHNFINSFNIKSFPNLSKPLCHLALIYQNLPPVNPPSLPEPTLVTGIADLLQIYISHQVGSRVTFYIEVINTTNITLTNVLIDVHRSHPKNSEDVDSSSIWSNSVPEVRCDNPSAQIQNSSQV